MGNSFAFCVFHKRKCPVPPVDILLFGSSCKDFSKASTAHASGEVIMNLERSCGGSAQTFKGASKYMSNHSVSIILFENVDSLEEGEMEDLSLMLQYFEDAGLTVKRFLLDSNLFGLPCLRRRLYIMCLKKVASPFFDLTARPIKEIFDLMGMCLQLCQREAPCASSVLCDDGDDAVEHELNKRMSTGRKATEYNVAASINQFTALGLRWGDVPVHESTSASPWYGTLANLQRTVLTFSEAEHPGDVLFRDIGQSTSRIRYSQVTEDGRHVGYCQMPNQLTWLQAAGKQPRLQLGREAMRLQGYPLAKVPALVRRTPESVMQDIGGNMMASVVPLALLQSALVAIRWCDVGSVAAPTGDDVDAAMSVFAATQSHPEEKAKPSRSEAKRRKIIG